MPTRPRLERDYATSEEGEDLSDPRIYPSLLQIRHPIDQSTGRSASLRHIQEPAEDYDIPGDYSNLDELAAPSPVHRTDTRQDVLENRLSSPRRRQTSRGDLNDRMQNITDVTAPPPQTVNPRSSLSASKRSITPSVDDGGRISRVATEFFTISHLIFFAILGTLARLGLQALTFYPGAPVQIGLLWANFAGSLIMGFLLEDKMLFHEHVGFCSSNAAKKKADEEGQRLYGDDPELLPYIIAARRQAASQQHAAVKKTIPLYIGLATGFCGSFTSFSSFIRDAFLALSNCLPVPVSHTSPAPIATASTVPRNGGYSFMAISAVIILTVILCLGALQTGAHLAIALEPFTPGIPELFARRIVDRIIMFLAWTAWLGAVLMTILPPDRPGGPLGQPSRSQEFWRGDALFALVFAPPGCLLRFYASLHLNGKIQSFPLGTFVVNILGTVVEGMLYDLQHVSLGGRVGCQVLQGLMDGFCGCLTTVSTWVAELKGLRIRHAYVYGSVSVGVAVGLMVIIMGSLQWTAGFGAPLCG